MSEQNKERLREAIEEIWNKGNLAALERYHTPDYVHRGSALAETSGLQALRQFVTAFRTAFPDGRFTIEHEVAEGETVVIRWRLTGTHQGEWLGVPATGRQVNFTGTSAQRFAGGKSAEQVWSDWDVMAMWQQLGVVSAPGQASGPDQAALEAAYQASKTGMMLYGGFFQDVAAEIGLERALALHAKRGEGFGAGLAQATKARLAGRQLDLSTLSIVSAETAAKGFGMTGEAVVSRGTLRTKWRRCPFYDGLAAAGLDHESIGRMCNALVAVECEALGKEFPGLTGHVEYRTAADQPCVEEFALAGT